MPQGGEGAQVLCLLCPTRWSVTIVLRLSHRTMLGWNRREHPHLSVSFFTIMASPRTSPRLSFQWQWIVCFGRACRQKCFHYQLYQYQVHATTAKGKQKSVMRPEVRASGAF